MPCVSANPCSAWGTKARRLPIAVGDKVRVRDDKTSDYWPAVVKSIEVDGMIVQWRVFGIVAFPSIARHTHMCKHVLL